MSKKSSPVLELKSETMDMKKGRALMLIRKGVVDNFSSDICVKYVVNNAHS